MARWFADAGATVCAVVGTSPETSAEAAGALKERYGIDCGAYSCVPTALAAETPDIVAVCSPFEHHRTHLELVSEAGIHCLCEKPLWWDEHPGRVAETERLAQSFARQGRLLTTITQWPFTLPAFFELHPAIRDAPVKSFAMELAPSRPGPAMVLDAAPHLLSMLVALAGDGTISSPSAHWRGDRNLTLKFTWDVGTSTPPVAASFELTTCERPPRPAGYAVNGHRARREILLPQYDMIFTDAGRQIRVEDPLKLLVADFLLQVERNARPPTATLVSGIQALELLCATAA